LTKKKINSTTQAFSLIELLVVVAILGIISAIGITSYQGYVSSTKKKSVENAMMQMSLAQT
jgi:type IV pilus assembly protein PilE